MFVNKSVGARGDRVVGRCTERDLEALGWQATASHYRRRGSLCCCCRLPLVYLFFIFESFLIVTALPGSTGRVEWRFQLMPLTFT